MGNVKEAIQKQDKTEKRSKIEKTAAMLFIGLNIPVYALLLFFTLTSTGRNLPSLEDEYIRMMKDSLWGNLMILLLIVGIAGVLGAAIGQVAEHLNMKLVCGAVCLATFGISLYWAGASKVEPMADQGYMCWFASDFNSGDFSALDQGGYVACYPQQLGVITVVRALFMLFGDGNHRAFQYFAACFVPLLVYAAYQITKILSEDDKRAECICLIFFLLCFPMYGYVPFVYGEIISTACAMVAVWMFLRCMEQVSAPEMILLGLSGGLAVLFRKNTLIVIVAFVIIGVIKLFQRNGWKLFAVSLCTVLGVLLLQLTVNGIYQKHMDPDADAIPASLFVVMGLNDDNGRPGGYNGYNYDTFAACEYDKELANRQALVHLKYYAQIYRENPVYMADFFLRKANMQWNAPMYQCRVMTSLADGERSELANSIYKGTMGAILEKIMEISQMAVYLGIFTLLWLCRKKWTAIENYVLLIAVYGGFLFSLLWEAKPRYVFPYYLMMIPCAAVGLGEIAKRIVLRINPTPRSCIWSRCSGFSHLDSKDH